MKRKRKQVSWIIDVDALDSKKEKVFLAALKKIIKTLEKLKKKNKDLFLPF